MILLVSNNLLGLYPNLWKDRLRGRNLCSVTKLLHAEGKSWCWRIGICRAGPGPQSRIRRARLRSPDGRPSLSKATAMQTLAMDLLVHTYNGGEAGSQKWLGMGGFPQAGESDTVCVPCLLYIPEPHTMALSNQNRNALEKTGWVIGR